jgi:hypothetical protein
MAWMEILDFRFWIEGKVSIQNSRFRFSQPRNIIQDAGFRM